jgi:hypothetical protein
MKSESSFMSAAAHLIKKLKAQTYIKEIFLHPF